MTPLESAGRKQLKEVLASAGFARNERLSAFLRFLVERRLEGRAGELKESVIGVEVFGRKPDYDPKQDAIVRTEAARLRARLSKYYETEGKGDELIIDLPKGGYVPVIRRRETTGPLRRSRRLFFAVAGLGVAVVLATGGWWRARHPTPVAIAVLPLENLSHDPGNDYLSDGLTVELIRNLSLIEGLAPRSRTSSFALRGKPLDIHEVGKRLGVDYVLEGSVLRSGQHLRIVVQFIRTRDDFSLWSERYDRELRDVLAIQDEISLGIVNGLRLKLGGGRRRYETSTEAYDLYLRARASDLQQGRIPVQLYEEVVAKDPLFAPAYAALAAGYAFRAGTHQRDRADERRKMRAAVEKAIQLDPLLAEAHGAMGINYALDGDWKRAEASFRRAIELDPNDEWIREHFALEFLLPMGRVEEALDQARVAVNRDPLSAEAQFDLAYVLTSAGRFAEAAGHCRMTPEDYAFRQECLGRALLGEGRTSEAIDIIATANPGTGGGRGWLGHAYARAGRHEEAEKIAEELAGNSYRETLVYAGMGDKERTLEALNRMTALGPIRIGRTLTFPEMAFVRDDPRTIAIRKRVGLP